MIQLSRLTDLAHQFIQPYLFEGALAVDATAGNGHDTLFLAECVGKTGRVLAFDRSESACETTRQKLSRLPHVHTRVVQDGHERLSHYLNESAQAFLYNLGYLPGQKNGTATRAETTLASLKQAAGLLALDGVIQVIFYRGHTEGKEEYAVVLEWVKSLDERVFKALYMEYINSAPDSPSILMIQRLK